MKISIPSTLLKLTIYSFVFFFSINSSCFAQKKQNRSVEINSIYEEIDCLNLASARQKAQALLHIKETIPQAHLLLNYADFLEIFISEEKVIFDSLSYKKKIRLKAFGKLDSSDPWKKYGKANILLQWAFCRIKFGEYFSALLEINKAFKLLKANTEQHPHFAPNYIGLGLLHTLIGAIPSDYQKMISFISSMEGSITQGKRELYAVCEPEGWNAWHPHLKSEALFFLTFIELNLSPERKKIPELLHECRQLPKSAIKKFLLASLYMRNYQNEEAIKTLETYQTSNTAIPFYFLNYLYGECLIRKLDPKAEMQFKEFLINFKGRHYIKSAYRFLAWEALLQEKQQAYSEYIALIPKKGNHMVDGDKQAQKEFKSQKQPQPDLLKARLAFDGGYFQKAIAHLNLAKELSDLSLKNKIEINYRLARIYQESKNKPQAIKFFKQTLEESKDYSWYFSGKSALELARIYESLNDLNLAKYYYKLCLDLDFDEYHSSITQKAKAGLNRVSDS